MNYTPIEQQATLKVGTVEFVSPDEIKVKLDIEAPDSISLTNGVPKPFPRINNYVLIHIEEGFIVGQIEWITIEETPYPKRKGLNDFGIVDLPYPTRKMCLNPIGTLIVSDASSNKIEFHRGVNVFPSVGDTVFLPTQKQLKAIIESGENRRIRIGTSPLVDNAEIRVDPDRLFGRHLAVLGNTGSGKSCSVAGLIRWSLEQGQEEITGKDEKGKPNARFIILDPNGEYKRAFADYKGLRHFSVEPSNKAETLNLPIWFWNTAEWYAFTQASGKTQKPILRRALGEIKLGQKTNNTIEEKKKLTLRRYLSYQRILLTNYINTNFIKEEATKFGNYLKAFYDDLQNKNESFIDFSELMAVVFSAVKNNKKSFNNTETNEIIVYYTPFVESTIEEIVSKLDEILSKMGGIVYPNNLGADTPIEFSPYEFVDYIETLAIQEKMSQYIDFLILRIRTMLSDVKMKNIVANQEKISLLDWLEKYIGKSDDSNGTITIIDMSLVPAELLHILTAVTSRMIFEALQRYRKLDEKHRCLPTVLVVEEAHNFIKRYRSETEEQSTEEICCQVFEKIAKEGRKFGLGLVLSSQRPSELSPTVLSQCNSFLLHRINNDKDQELVYRFIPDNLKGLLRDLPSLPSRNAILLGWVSELPLLVKIDCLPKEQQPQSDDPDFWAVWTREVEREVDWTQIVNDWQGKDTT